LRLKLGPIRRVEVKLPDRIFNVTVYVNFALDWEIY